jgi:uncharacterized protein (DUF1501 family)
MPVTPRVRAPPDALWSRRGLLGAGAAGLALAAAPRPSRAADPADRRFVFVFVEGGWDITYAIAPMFDNPRVAAPTGGCGPGMIGDLPIVDNPRTVEMRAFLEEAADDLAVLHGFEVRSVAHDACRRILLTGGAGLDGDDWAHHIASRGAGARMAAPHLVLAGPGYAAALADRGLRLGRSAQLGALLQDEAQRRADAPPPPLPAAARAEAAAWLEARAAALADRGAVYSAHADALARADALQADARGLDLGAVTTLSDQADLAASLLASGLCRTLMLRHKGFLDLTWDSHGGIDGQHSHWDDLGRGLAQLRTVLARTRGTLGGSLADEVVVVVLSEMSRTPALNASGGKDHWTWTSAMLWGPGVRGGRAYGGYDGDVFGQPLDLASGEVHAGGQRLRSLHLGATLLALADVDPQDALGADALPVRGLIA